MVTGASLKFLRSFEKSQVSNSLNLLRSNFMPGFNAFALGILLKPLLFHLGFYIVNLMTPFKHIILIVEPLFILKALKLLI